MDKAVLDFKKSFETDQTTDSSVKAVTIAKIMKCYNVLDNNEEYKKWSKIALELFGKNDLLNSDETT